MDYKVIKSTVSTYSITYLFCLLTTPSIHQPPSNHISHPFKAKPVKQFAYCWFCHPCSGVIPFQGKRSMNQNHQENVCGKNLQTVDEVQSQGSRPDDRNEWPLGNANRRTSTHHASLWSDVRRLLVPGLMPTQREWDTRATGVASSQPGCPAAQLSQKTHKLF